MSDAPIQLDQPNAPSYLQRGGIFSWLLTTDHKRIGVLYLISITALFLFGVSMAFTFRLELLSPGMQLMSLETYNRMLTLHGVTMIFLFIIPAIPSIFGNFLLPIMLGANDVYFPRLNLLSWYCYVVGALMALASVAYGGPNTGWTFYVPFSVETEANIFIPLSAVVVLGWSSILTGLNFVTTVHRLRAPGQTWFRLPLFVWALYATAWTQLLVTPVLAITLVLVVLDRLLNIGMFDPGRGGDPILYQHLFWIYSHPSVYIMILPAMGAVSEIIPTFARRTIFGYKFIAMSSVAIAGIGSLVWGHHMFTSGQSDTARIVFSFLTFLVAVPSGVKVFNWVATLYKGSIVLHVALVFTLMFIVLFTIGGLTGLMQGALALNIHIHDTAFIVAHFHYVMFGGAGVMFFAALHYWWPKMFGRLYNTSVALAAALIFFVGFNLLYFPLLVAGLEGMPRRYGDYLPYYTVYHQLSTVGSWILVFAILLMFANLVRSLRSGPRAPRNPWGSTSIEWFISSPPREENFEHTPEIRAKPYTYPQEVQDDPPPSI